MGQRPDRGLLNPVWGDSTGLGILGLAGNGQQAGSRAQAPSAYWPPPAFPA